MANAVSPAPVGLASTVAGPAIASTVGGLIIPGLSFNLLSMLNSTKITAGVSALALASLVGTYVAMNSENVRLRSEITALRSRPAQAAMQVLASATESQVQAGELARLRTEHSELMRLRGEVGQLRRELAQLAAEQVERDHLSVQRKAEADLVSAKRKFLIPWAQAFGEFARENMGRMPATIEEAAKYIPRSVQAVAESFPIEDFEIVFQGSLQALTDPWDIIILREKRPFQFNPGSHALRTYLFADGHCEVRIAADGNFEPWEHQHLASTLPLSSSASE